MITYKMHFIRSGSWADGAEIRYAGQSDRPLCEKGVRDLEKLRRECVYPQVDMVFTSPLRRCVQTADILYPESCAEQVDGLMDMNLGRFEGRTFAELKGDEDFSPGLKNSSENPPPGGENTADFTGRIIGAVKSIFQRMMEERLTSVAVITHGGVVMSLMAGIGLPKMPLHQWATAAGMGYTVLFTPQMWMRDGCGEVFARLPYEKTAPPDAD